MVYQKSSSRLLEERKERKLYHSEIDFFNLNQLNKNYS